MENLKKLFKGNKKIITIPLFFGLLITFLPISIGLGLIWLTVKKVKNQKVKTILLIIISSFTLLFGGGWIYAISQPTQPKTEEKTTITPTPTQAPAEELSPTQVQEQSETTTSDKQEAKVVRVVDGDTVEVSFDGKTEKVRLIGVDTPETVDPRKTVQCFGEKASNVTKNELTGKTVWLESDATQGDRDKYSRLLRYVWIDDGTVDFGKVLIATGFAYEYTYNTPYKYQSSYKQAQSEAEQGKKGLWADGACPVTPTVTKSPTVIPTKVTTIKPTSTPTKTTTTSTSTTSTSGSCKYSCSGPDRDCSDFSSHTEAQTFFNCCGFTAENDPMKLDSTGVGDGIACESI